ncbi:hypothetical protein VNO77_04071 [Canavalia gladiata]|uniref:Uncharacterized protein n=1 Tax=Canavalia gladiata TaxID=3824 RepID=A0AAN9MVW1_CANGL
MGSLEPALNLSEHEWMISHLKRDPHLRIGLKFQRCVGYRRSLGNLPTFDLNFCSSRPRNYYLLLVAFDCLIAILPCPAFVRSKLACVHLEELGPCKHKSTNGIQ